jgi:hypothetical protein
MTTDIALQVDLLEAPHFGQPLATTTGRQRWASPQTSRSAPASSGVMSLSSGFCSNNATALWWASGRAASVRLYGIDALQAGGAGGQAPPSVRTP